MSETISRDSAINELERAEVRVNHSVERAIGRGIIEILDDVEKSIIGLPPTQPEIIYCKDCKHHWTYKSMDRMPIEICDLEQTFYDAEHDFCSLAERRKNG